MSERPGPMRIRLADERRALLVQRVCALFREEFDAELSAFRAERVVALFVRELGPQVYNQAIRDAHGFVVEKLEDLAGELYEPEDVAGAPGPPAPDRG